MNYAIKDPLLLSSFHTISTPFKLCNSKYILDKWLKTKNLFSHINQFTFHYEINLISSLYETNYSEHIINANTIPI